MSNASGRSRNSVFRKLDTEPRTFGTMRKHYHPELAKRAVGEVLKGVAARSTDDIAGIVATS